MHQEDYSIQNQMSNPISYAASTNKDTMYWHEAMKQPDAEEFKKAAITEFDDHCMNRHWVIIEKSQVQKGKNILLALWAMGRKGDLITGKRSKYKARLNVHGGNQIYGLDYFETYSTGATCVVIRFIMILSILHKWNSKQN